MNTISVVKGKGFWYRKCSTPSPIDQLHLSGRMESKMCWLKGNLGALEMSFDEVKQDNCAWGCPARSCTVQISFTAGSHTSGGMSSKNMNPKIFTFVLQQY